ncbi:MAG: AGE family epimerase/isomerase [Planctomycetes bacterium]|nr:AGE family epimerase/isomerase [Planctomycetota bacterium]
MIDRGVIENIRTHTRSYLTDVLLPFWIARSPDPEYGGFLTYFDRDGRPTGETSKTFLMQIRMLYSMSAAHRAGYGGGRCAELAKMGASFILDHYWDENHGGWIWIADRNGTPTVTDKVGYGQCFGMYAFSEYFLATGDPRGREAAERTYAAIAENMIDTRYGGYYELMRPDWQLAPPGEAGGDRKSLDVHMHLMEALTTFYEMTGGASHRRRLIETIGLITSRMLHPERRTGYAQFTRDFRPLPAIIFDTQWGRDARPEDGAVRPIDTTSYGHNIELVWLLMRAVDVLGGSRDEFAETARKISDHCVEYGIDREFGRVYCEGAMDRPTTLFEKQFWQQAEMMVGMLDAYATFGDQAYWDGFVNVHEFVFDKFVQMDAGGEWLERVSRDGSPVDDALGHAWKISYHTVRSMIEVVRRLESLESDGAAKI